MLTACLGVLGPLVTQPVLAADSSVEFTAEDDLLVKGTEGTLIDPDVEVLGVSRFDKAIHAGDLLASPYGGIGRYENLLERSEALDDAAWTKTGGVTASANAVAGPDGTTSAETLTDDVTAGGTLTQTEAVTLSADTSYTFSIWLKAGTGTTAKLKLEGNATGEVATETAALTITATWQRFSVTDTITNNTAGGETLTATLNHTGGASNTLHAWGAQLEQASAPGVYVKTTGSSIASGRGLIALGSGVVFPDGTAQTTAVQTVSGFTIDTSGNLTTNLVSYWRLDEATGTQKRDDVSLNDGTATNGPTIVTGKLGKALSFDGTDDHISLSPSNFPSGATPRTVSVWFKTATVAEQLIFSYGTVAATQEWQLFTATDTGCGAEGGSNAQGTIGLGTSGAGNKVCGVQTVTDNVWHHAVGVYDGTTIKIYIDGVLKNSGPRTSALGLSYARIGGGYPNAPGYYFNGTIDEVALWSKALSAAEITDLYNSGSANAYRTSTAIGGWTDDGTVVRLSTGSDAVGIGTTSPAATAILDLTSTTKGLLAPRMTTTQRDAITSPAAGLLLYNTTTNAYNVYNGTAWGAVGGGSGTVTSVGLSAPAEFTVSGSPLTTSGTLTLGLATQTANVLFGGPAAGVAAAPSFRALVDADLPDTLTASNYLPLAGGTLTGNLVLPNAGTIGQAAGPLLTFDDTANELEISGGNVGIGTASPAQKLHVEGGQCVTGDTLLPVVRTQEARSWKLGAGSGKVRSWERGAGSQHVRSWELGARSWKLEATDRREVSERASLSAAGAAQEIQWPTTRPESRTPQSSSRSSWFASSRIDHNAHHDQQHADNADRDPPAEGKLLEERAGQSDDKDRLAQVSDGLGDEFDLPIGRWFHAAPVSHAPRALSSEPATQDMAPSPQLLTPSPIEYIPIVEVKPGDYVLSLNEQTGKLEPRRINGLLDMGVQPVFRLTTASGRTIRTTGNHPYLVNKLGARSPELGVGAPSPQLLAPNSQRVQGEWRKVVELAVGEAIAVPKAFSGRVSSWPLVGDQGTSGATPPPERPTPLRGQASVLPSNRLAQVGDDPGDELPSRLIDDRHHFLFYPAFRALSRVAFSTTPQAEAAIVAAPQPGATPISPQDHGSWIMDHGSPPSTIHHPPSDILWDPIVAIEAVGREAVYDIEVEGTHNFVAGHWLVQADDGSWIVDRGENSPPSTIHDPQSSAKRQFGGLIAHNTYLKGATADSTAAALHAVNSAATSLLYVRNDGNVGIGTATPAQKLSVAGTVESTSGGFKFPDGGVQDAAVTSVPGFKPDTSGALATNLSNYWNLDETSGTVATDAKGSKDSTLTNGPTWVAGKVGNAVSFDGVNDFVNVDPSGLTNFTIAAWIKPSANPVGAGGILDDEVCGQVDDMGLRMTSTGKLEFQHGDTSATAQFGSTATIVLNTWTHVAAVRDTSAGNTRLYINGALDSTFTNVHSRSLGGANPTCDVYANRWAIGHAYRGAQLGGTGFNGLIDEVAVWTRTLIATEITDLYNSGNANAYKRGATIGGWTDDGTVVRLSTGSDAVGIGTTSPAATALLDLTSTTKGLLAPRMTTTQRDAITSPAAGLLLYNTTTNAYNVYNGTSWGAVGGGSGDVLTTGTNTFTATTASPILIKPSAAPTANTKLLDMQATGAGTTTFSVDAEGDVIANSLDLATPLPDAEVADTITASNYLPLAGGTLTGNLVIPNAGTIGQAAGPLLTFDDTANELEITGGNVGIGTASPSALLHIARTGGDNAIRYHAASSGAGSEAYLDARKSRGTVAAPTAVLSGDGLGGFAAAGHDGTNFIYAAEIYGQVDGTPGANDMPGRLVFYTTADGAAAGTERMRITSAGNVGIGTASPGAKLEISGVEASDGSAVRLKNTTATTGKTYKLVSKDNGTVEIVVAGTPDKVVARMGVK